MEISAAALPFLILAAVLGPPAQAFLKHRPPPTPIPGMHRPGGCCLSYITEIMDCKFMMNYFPRVNGCSLPAVVFKTKEGIDICASSGSETVKQCMEHLDSIRKPEEEWDEEELQ